MDPIVQYALTALASIVETLRNPAVGGVILTVSGLMVADFITALAASYRTKTVEPLFLATFLRSHVLGGLFPIVGLILLSTFVQPLVAVVALAVGAYSIQTLASIKANLDLPKDA